MSKHGDIWRSKCGLIEFRCGRWQDVLSDVERVDAVITDPPYDSCTHTGALTTSDKIFGVEFDALSDPEDIVAPFLDVAKTWLLFFCSLEMLGKYQSAKPDRYVRSGIWDRICNSPQMSGDRPAQGAEGIAIFHRTRKNMKWNGHGKAAIWRYMVERGKKQHPTQKPLSLMITLVKLFTNTNDLVCDPYAGSGTTLLAAAIEGRRAIGAEMDPNTFDLAVRRLEAGYTPRLF